MDQEKIGKYIADKRKALGYTQVQLAQRLGMSDKSVSKWERGVCLPDVSVYGELCDALGISLNEFFAGEDLTAERIPMQSERNLMGVARDGKTRRIRLRRMVALLLAALVLLGGVGVWLLHGEGYFEKNYVRPYDKTATERNLAALLAGSEGLYMMQYDVDASYQYLRLEAVTYRHGRETDRKNLGDVLDENNRRGTLVLLPDSIRSNLKMVIASPVTKDALDGEFTYWTEESGFGFVGRELEECLTVEPERPLVLAALCFDRGDIREIPLREIGEDPDGALSDVDLCVYFTATFLREIPA